MKIIRCVIKISENIFIKKLFRTNVLCFLTLFFFSSMTLGAPAVESKISFPAEHPHLTPEFNSSIMHWETPQGTKVYFIETHALPIIDIQIAFKAGSAYDGQQPGLASLTNNLLQQGTTHKTADQIADQLDLAGATFQSAVNRDMAVVKLRSVTFPKQLNLALSTFKEVLSHPSFPADAFARLQKQTQQYLNYQEQNPAQVAGKQFFSLIYNQHPYATPVRGTLAQIPLLKREDAQAFYQRYYTANNAVMAIVGNVTENEAKKISRELTEGLNKGEKIPALAKVKKNGTLTHHTPFPSNQTHILMGQVALSKKDPDFFPLLVANYVFGGDVTSRLFTSVRANEGLAYNVGSGFQPLQAEGPFYIRLQTENGQTQKAISLIKKLMNDFIAKGPTSAELNASKEHLIQNFILNLSTNEALVNNLMDIGFYGLPLNYLSTFQANVKAVTQDQVQKALKKHLSPDHFALITVGKDA